MGEGEGLLRQTQLKSVHRSVLRDVAGSVVLRQRPCNVTVHNASAILRVRVLASS